MRTGPGRARRAGLAARATVVAATVARAVLGGFWLHEAFLKFTAHFGGADIGLVVDSAATNPRVSDLVAEAARQVLSPTEATWGVVVPLWEATLGVLLILGVLPRLLPAAAGVTLATYWSTDQLVWQYPVMAALAVIAAAVPGLGIGALVRRCTRRRRQASEPANMSATSAATSERSERVRVTWPKSR